MVPSTSQVPQPLPRVLYSLHIDDEEPISCVVRIRDNGADMVLIRSRHDTPWRMRINSSYPDDVVWKVGMGMFAGFSPQWSMKLIVSCDKERVLRNKHRLAFSCFSNQHQHFGESKSFRNIKKPPYGGSLAQGYVVL